MKKLPLLVLLLCCMSWACKKDDPSPLDGDIFSANSRNLLATASFVNSPVHSTSGTVKVYSDANNKYLVFENFKTDRGPDLYVYMATDLKASNFVSISKLDKFSGNFYYKFDKSIDEKTKDKVLIWCKDFSVLFGSADL
jgi:Electron transfer DM13